MFFSFGKSRIARNAGWIITGRIVQSLLAFIITFFTARFLGPANYGVMSYAASLNAFVLPIAQLGLNSILVHEIINNPKEEGKIIGTSLVMCTISAILCILGLSGFCAIVNGGERETQIICALYSISLIFNALEIIQYWFQAKLLSKYTSIIMLIAYLIVSVYKIYLLATGKSVYWFSVSQAFDCAIIAVSLIVIYKMLGGQTFGFSLAVAKRMLSKSAYYILSGIMGTVFAQIGRILLKLISGNAEAGYYSVAVTCAGVASFVFSAIIDSFRPVVFQKKKESEEEFEDSVIKLYSVIVFLALAFSVFMFSFSDILIRVLYGEEYIDAVAILRIIVWYCTFSYFGGARAVWILAEEKQKYILIINLLGAIVNVLLNIWLIPCLQGVGAALASLLTQIFTNIILFIIIRPLRRNLYLLLKALNPKILISLIKTG